MQSRVYLFNVLFCHLLRCFIAYTHMHVCILNWDTHGNTQSAAELLRNRQRERLFKLIARIDLRVRCVDLNTCSCDCLRVCILVKEFFLLIDMLIRQQKRTFFQRWLNYTNRFSPLLNRSGQTSDFRY